MTCSAVNYLARNCYRTARKFSGLQGKSADCTESQRTARKINGLHEKLADCRESQRIAWKVRGQQGKSADCTESQRTAGHCTAMTVILKLWDVKY